MSVLQKTCTWEQQDLNETKQTVEEGKMRMTMV